MMALNSRAIKIVQAKKGHLLKDDPKLKQAVRNTFLLVQDLTDKVSVKSIYVEVPLITPDEFNPDIQRAKVQRNTIDSSTVTQRTQNNTGGDSAPRTPPGNNRKPSGSLVANETPKKDTNVLDFYSSLENSVLSARCLASSLLSNQEQSFRAMTNMLGGKIVPARVASSAMVGGCMGRFGGNMRRLSVNCLVSTLPSRYLL
jgi:hypothetical protein